MQAAMSPAPSCVQLREAVRKAAEMWADRHPRLYFKEVGKPGYTALGAGWERGKPRCTQILRLYTKQRGCSIGIAYKMGCLLR
jgi:hypothetical protein